MTAAGVKRVFQMNTVVSDGKQVVKKKGHECRCIYLKKAAKPVARKRIHLKKMKTFSRRCCGQSIDEKQKKQPE